MMTFGAVVMVGGSPLETVDRVASATELRSGSETHWSLRKRESVTPPQMNDPWIANAIDAFVLSRLQEAGLKPSPAVRPSTLIRRAYLVMHGLPPTPEQVESASLGKSRVSSQSWRRLVDQLLGSPRYGERWAQHWLDVVRWAETWGYETNSARSDAWPYRDWVIQSLNADLPYDQFVTQQIAGDTLGVDAATGFLVAGPANLPGQIGKGRVVDASGTSR